jgi:hypothetical protein
MTEPMAERVEQALTQLLEEARPGGGAPVELRHRVRAIPSTRAWKVMGLVAGLRLSILDRASVATAALFVMLLLTGSLSGAAIQDTGSPSTESAPNRLDLEIDGPGLVDGVDERIAWLVAGVVNLLLIAAAVAGRGWRRAILGLGVIGIAVSVAAVSSQDTLSVGYDYSPVAGLHVTAEAPPGSGGPGVYYVTAEAGAPFAVKFSLHNPGPLPVVVEGLVIDEPRSIGASAIRLPRFRWSAMWYGDDPFDSRASKHLQPLGSVKIRSGKYLEVVAVGRAGQCALGHAFDAEHADTLGYVTAGDLRIAYTVMGWPHEAVVQLPFRIAEPLDLESGCA